MRMKLFSSNNMLDDHILQLKYLLKAYKLLHIMSRKTLIMQTSSKTSTKNMIN